MEIYRGYKIEKINGKYKVFTRFLLFWWVPIKRFKREYNMLKRVDAEFDDVYIAKFYIDGQKEL